MFIFFFGCMRGISLNQTNSRDGQAAWLRSQCPKVSHKHSCQNWHTIFISAHTFACVSFVQLMVRLGIKSVFWQADSGALKLLSIHYFFFGVKSQVYWASNTFCPYTEKGQKRQWFFAAIHDFLFNNAKHLLSSRELNCAMSTTIKVIKTIIMYHFPQLGPIHTATETGWQPHGWGKITNE